MILTNSGISRHPRSGYSLPELVIVVVILGVLASISIAYISETWKGQIAIANLENMRAWIESVRRSSLRGQSCTIAITTTNLRDSGLVLDSEPFINSSINTSPCGSPTSLSLESNYRKEHYLLSVKTGASNVSSFVMTPRGTLFNTTATPAFPDDIIFNLSIANSNYQQTSKSYCLRMSGFLGTIEAIGSRAC